MPFDRPTLAELRDRTKRDFNARLPGADALLRQSNLSVIADVLAGLSTLHYGYQVWLSKQLFPDTAETAFFERGAAWFWAPPRRPATAAFGALDVRGTVGAVVPPGAEFQRLDRIRYRAPDG